jgi:CubicO group peptidase (beta-lactamase class C family)
MRKAIIGVVLIWCVVAGPDRAGMAASQSALAAAFPDIDRLFTEFAKTAHVPGAAWGIVIDGKLAHSGAAGVRDIAANAPVDADTVFRIASMTKSFTAMSILKLRDEGKLSLDDPAERYVQELKSLRYPTTDSPQITIRHLLTHSEGFPEDNPWGDQQLAKSEEQFSSMLRGGIPFSTARHRLRVFELWLRDPRPDRVARVRHAVRRACHAEHPAPAGDDVHDAASVEGAGGPTGDRISVGRRPLEGRAGAPARIVRRDGRDADVDP